MKDTEFIEELTGIAHDIGDEVFQQKIKVEELVNQLTEEPELTDELTEIIEHVRGKISGLNFCLNKIAALIVTMKGKE